MAAGGMGHRDEWQDQAQKDPWMAASRHNLGDIPDNRTEFQACLRGDEGLRAVTCLVAGIRDAAIARE